MTFENSPRLDPNGRIKPSFSGWLAAHRGLVTLIFVAAFLIGLTMLYLQLQPVLHPAPPGGLEGCLVDTDGTPLTGSVSVGEITRPVYEDGCFFFPALPGGEQHLLIRVPSGEESLPIQVVSNEMQDLGEIVVTP